MGGTKRLMEEREARYQWGLETCLEAGAIEECEYHPGSYYEGGESVEEALAKASTEEEENAIQEAFDDNSGIDYCPSCDKNARD